MVGYSGDAALNAEAMAGGRYHTGDVARRDGDGYITYVGRTDDVFKASDYRISPFELESVLIEHPVVPRLLWCRFWIRCVWLFLRFTLFWLLGTFLDRDIVLAILQYICNRLVLY